MLQQQACEVGHFVFESARKITSTHGRKVNDQPGEVRLEDGIENQVHFTESRARAAISRKR